MGELIRWTDDMLMGVAEFDEHHRTLVKIINRVGEIMELRRAPEEMNTAVAELLDYTDYHFRAEEERMEAYGFEGLADHKEEHDQLRAKVRQLDHRLKNDHKVLTMDVLMFLVDWLRDHLDGTDSKYRDFFREKGVN